MVRQPPWRRWLLLALEDDTLAQYLQTSDGVMHPAEVSASHGVDELERACKPRP